MHQKGLILRTIGLISPNNYPKNYLKFTLLSKQLGYIKLHRSLLDKAYYSDSEYIHLWVHLLLRANYSDGEWFDGANLHKLKAGQLVTGRKKLSAETGIGQSKIERALKMFEKCGQIEQQTNSRNRIITILSWDKYQINEQQTNSPRTAREQPANTNKNSKESKESKEIKCAERENKFLEEVKGFSELYSTDMLNAFFAYWSQWDKNRTKMRWEKEQTWETNKRLYTWKNR